MWRASLVALALAATAGADTRDELAAQLLDESRSVDTAVASVTEKLVTTDAERAKRLAAAYRTLHATSHDAMTSARRRAAARLLVGRDLEERRLLAEELAELNAARTRISGDVTKLPTLVLPASLQRPAQGTIARKFGTLLHERSKAVLSRRGVDIEVEAKSTVVAPADGVVRYAGPIRGLDNGVIIDHGGYLTVLAKLGDVAAPVGVPVKRGDRIGQAARHRAYVEVRVKIGPSGLPIDPEPLFAR
ncbi:MAG TPA: M23 family metallopeptidase [Kofleriaceae bacterium]|nr:M23 family metallopeptidase [Kofleriaceae bacterium]